MAAATEKFIRNTPDIIHSEDLTASQFAHLTGINTKRNSLYSIDESESESDMEDDCYYSTTNSALTHDTAIQIWDSQFWNQGKHAIISPAEKMPSMIQKGRFKIVWGQIDDDTVTYIQPSTIRCVEWKRKRASSNPIVTDMQPLN
ncbi:uncharacterized protein B0P05DRAFT_576241 [Gilbertella persicaria]|uniref:uncharacterized protein n=1 Tax=Gilbertella persicaria TaxID=101096 RepID=UPI00221EA09B|nr:uncharacterized protein B0P05DRAFT_576241 [Gilbertella persicaria]KAI8047677.1 hypothetical protein B0P05DRAFT_576241 [Gilbertella persicaria]